VIGFQTIDLYLQDVSVKASEIRELRGIYSESTLIPYQDYQLVENVGLSLNMPELGDKF
jgi:hypothetical protein